MKDKLRSLLDKICPVEMVEESATVNTPETSQELIPAQEAVQEPVPAQDVQPAVVPVVDELQYAMLKKQYDQSQENLQNLKLVLEQKDIEIKELKEKLQAQTLPAEESTTKETEPAPLESSKLDIGALLTPIKEMIDVQNTKLLTLCQQLQEQNDSITDKYDAITRQMQEDRYRKDKVKILSRTIRMRGMITDMLADYDNDAMSGNDTPAAQHLKLQLHKIIDCLEADLRQEMVYKLENGVEGADFNDELMEACGVELTDKPELSGKVCRSVEPGYYWTLPYILKPRISDTGEEIYSYKFILSYEQVITYKYQKQ
jgi:molecular chaperone GrpE (heat shock protein)